MRMGSKPIDKGHYIFTENEKTDFLSKDGTARTYCMIWSEKFKNEKGWENSLNVIVYDNEFKNFLQNEAWGN